MTESLHTNSVSLWLMLKRLFDESSYLPLLLVLLTTSSVFVNNGARFHNPFTPVSPFKKDRTMGLKVPTYVYLGENLVLSMTYNYISFDMVIDSDRIPWQLKTKSPAETVLMSLCNCYQSAKFISQGELFLRQFPRCPAVVEQSFYTLWICITLIG